MSFFSRTQSPVLTMPPSVTHRTPFGLPLYPRQPSPLSFHSARSQAPARPETLQRGSRKRSRDEAAVNLDVEEAKLETVEPVKEPEDHWIYGEGMVLIKSPSTYVADAGSQSGTWVEEKAAADEKRKNEHARALDQQLRPSLRSSKSQRLDMTAMSTPNSDSASHRSSSPRHVGVPSTAAGPCAETCGQPIVDNFTLHLGIGWRRIGADDGMQAAARGWARYIENNYPITNVQIQLESKGLQSYLVEASEGYFLFAENLRHGQLVSKNLDQAFQNLKSTPPVFEDLNTMIAADTPQPVHADVEMDLS